MFEPLDERLAPSVRRWQAPRLGADAGSGELSPASSADALRRAASEVDAASNGSDADARVAPDEAALQARFDEGWARGLVEGQAAASAASLGVVAALIADLTRERDRRDTVLEDELLALARAMARLILHRELEHDAGMMQGLVREALAELPVSAEIPVVALHPEDAAAVVALMPEAEAERVVADPALARGGCRVELGDSIVDAGIDAWLSRIASGDGRLEPLDGASSAS